MNGVAVIDRVTIDCIYSDFKSYPKKGEEICTKNFSMSLGGGACVIPIRLSQMGLKARFGTFLGEDSLSDIARSLLEKFPLQNVHNFYKGSECPVVYSTVFSAEDDRGILSFDAGVDEAALTDGELYEFLKNSDVCFAPKRESVVKKLHNDGTAVVYDSHWVEGQTLDDYKAIIKYADFFTPNDKEAMALTDTNNAEDALRVLLDYTRNPIVKTGKNGCIAKIHGDIVHFPAPAVKSLDTTGAGDNFLTGLTFGICHRMSLERCVELANIAGALSTTANGCFAARYDLNDYLEKR